MLQFKIADLVLNIDCQNELITDRLSDFVLNQPLESGFYTLIEGSNHIEVPSGKTITDEQIAWLCKPAGQEGYFLYYKDPYMARILCLMDVDKQWNRATLKYLYYQGQGFDYRNLAALYSHFMLGTLFRNYILYHSGIVIHSSTLVWNGKGIMFSAPSGTGKSTHVRLWQEYFGPEIIVLNDDTPAIRFRDGKPYIFGTPWSGASSIHYNSHAPLNTIVLLEQSPINTIRELTTREAVLMMMPRAFLPYYDQDMMNLACDIFEKIVESVPVYLLKCKPDRAAVELVSQWVK